MQTSTDNTVLGEREDESDDDLDVLEKFDSPRRPVYKRPRNSVTEMNEGDPANSRKLIKLSHGDPLDDAILRKKIGISVTLLTITHIIVITHSLFLFPLNII